MSIEELNDTTIDLNAAYMAAQLVGVKTENDEVREWKSRTWICINKNDIMGNILLNKNNGWIINKIFSDIPQILCLGILDLKWKVGMYFKNELQKINRFTFKKRIF